MPSRSYSINAQGQGDKLSVSYSASYTNPDTNIGLTGLGLIVGDQSGLPNTPQFPLDVKELADKLLDEIILRPPSGAEIEYFSGTANRGEGNKNIVVAAITGNTVQAPGLLGVVVGGSVDLTRTEVVREALHYCIEVALEQGKLH